MTFKGLFPKSDHLRLTFHKIYFDKHYRASSSSSILFDIDWFFVVTWRYTYLKINTTSWRMANHSKNTKHDTRQKNQNSCFREMLKVVVTEEDCMNHGRAMSWVGQASHCRCCCGSQTTEVYEQPSLQRRLWVPQHYSGVTGNSLLVCSKVTRGLKSFVA